MSWTVPPTILLACMTLALSMSLDVAPLLADTVTTTYDDLGRVTQLLYDDGMRVVYTYDSAGNRATVVISGVATNGAFHGRVTFNGIRPAPPDATWQVPLLANFLQPSTATVLTRSTPITDTSGNFISSNVPPRSYDVQVKWAGALSKIARNVTVVTGDNPLLNFGQLALGDVNNDDVVDLLDFSILRTTFGRCASDAGFDARADLNGDGCVDLLDFSLLRTNFGQAGPQIVP